MGAGNTRTAVDGKDEAMQQTSHTPTTGLLERRHSDIEWQAVSAELAALLQVAWNQQLEETPPSSMPVLPQTASVRPHTLCQGCSSLPDGTAPKDYDLDPVDLGAVQGSIDCI